MIDRYLDELQPRLRGSWWHRRRVIQEVGEHLGETAAGFERGGMLREEAERRAVERFGSAESTAALLRGPRRWHRRAAYAAAVAAAITAGVVVLGHGGRATPAGPSVVRWVSHTVPMPDRSGWAVGGPLDAPRCRAADLRPQSAGMQGATSRLVGVAVVKNIGGADCTLAGVPTVALVDAAGAVVTVRQSDEHGLEDAPPWRGYPVVSLRAGQTANLRYTWTNGCDPRKATRVRITLGGATFSVPLFSQDSRAGDCTFPGKRSWFRVRQWLPDQARQIPEVTAFAKLPIHVRLTAPHHVTPGEHITYLVTLINYAPHPVTFTRCPTYTQTLGGGYWRSLRARRAFVLNCQATRTIPRGGRAVYQMRFTIPRRGYKHHDQLFWSITDGPARGAEVTVG